MNLLKSTYNLLNFRNYRICKNEAQGISKSAKKKKIINSVPPTLRSKNDTKISKHNLIVKTIQNNKKHSSSNSKSLDNRVLNTFSSTNKIENFIDINNPFQIKRIRDYKKGSKFISFCNITLEDVQENKTRIVTKGNNFSMTPSVREINTGNKDFKAIKSRSTHKNLIELEKQKYYNNELKNKKNTSINNGLSLLKFSESKERSNPTRKEEKNFNFKKSKFNKGQDNKSIFNLDLKSNRLYIDDLKQKIIKSKREFDNLNQNTKYENEGRRVNQVLHSHR
jgi:hypothetical protein